MKLWDIEEFMRTYQGRLCPEGFCYNSGANTQWLSVEEIRELIRRHVDPQFNV
jgi:hypothetical protein